MEYENTKNRHNPGGKERFEQHWKLFREIWAETAKLIVQAAKEGFKVAIEWPSGCTYWK